MYILRLTQETVYLFEAFIYIRDFLSLDLAYIIVLLRALRALHSLYDHKNDNYSYISHMY